jgi:branched-chain amino acid aminotransferase
MKSLVSVNGTITTPEEARIPALDRGFLFGDDVFETLVCFNGVILNKSNHLERLRQSAEMLGMEIPWRDDELSFELDGLAQMVQSSKLAIRLVVTRGNGMGLKPQFGISPNKVVYVSPAQIETSKTRDEGLSLQLRALPYTERKAAAKTGNYLRSILALQQLQGTSYDEILWENSEREIAEAATANIFFIGRNGDQVEIATPAENTGILLGITRQTLCNYLNSKKVPVTERIIFSEEIPRFDEAFLCSTVRGLIPIKSINRHQYFTTRPTSIFHMIRRLYDAWVFEKLGYRVDWNTGEKI